MNNKQLQMLVAELRYKIRKNKLSNPDWLPIRKYRKAKHVAIEHAEQLRQKHEQDKFIAHEEMLFNH